MPDCMAEREGFEPSVPVTQYARLAISRQPANTGPLPRLLETDNPCGSAICRMRVNREMSRRVSPDLIQSGKFTPPCPHPKGSETWEASPNQNAANVPNSFSGNPQNGWVSMNSNPYVEARREWDERYADLVLGKRNWQITAGGLLLLSLILAAGVVWQSTRSRFIPYVVEVDKLGYGLTVPKPLIPSRIRRSLIAWSATRLRASSGIRAR